MLPFEHEQRATGAEPVRVLWWENSLIFLVRHLWHGLGIVFSFSGEECNSETFNDLLISGVANDGAGILALCYAPPHPTPPPLNM